jgi:hypothetical protein
MANEVYGEAGKNTFTIPNVVGFFSTTVNKETGVTELYKQGAFLTQQSIGTYNPSTAKFTPQANSSITQSEITRISSPEGLNAVKGAAIQTATKGGATNANQLISKNTANPPNPSGGDQQAGANENAAVVAELKKESKEGTRKDYGNVQYPVDLNPAVQDCIKFSIFEYKAPGVQPGTSAAGSRIVSLVGGNPGFKTGKDRNILGTITLPIPGGINDSNSADWQNDLMGELTRALANISGQTILGGGQQGAATAGGEITNLNSGGGTDLKSIIAAQAAQAASGASNLISRQFGAVVNPNLELLFNGPSLRTFGFNFRMSPRDAPEARNIRKIIRFFKQAMSVKRSNSSLLLKAPHTFAISYVTSDKEHPYLNRFKECALTVCNVNYTPDGTYMTYKEKGIDDRSMTAYELSLTFQEIEPIFDDDYGNEKEITSIGF